MLYMPFPTPSFCCSDERRINREYPNQPLMVDPAAVGREDDDPSALHMVFPGDALHHIYPGM
jgi:hypothetical protein